VEVSYVYSQTSLLAYLMEKYEVKVLEDRYDEQIRQKLQINCGLSEAFKQELYEKSNGAIRG
jgi:putative IMPACT (imprinted ancient) family translation regulator